MLTAAHCVSPATIGANPVIDLLPGTTLALPGITTSSRTFNPAWNVNNLQACHDEGILHTTQTLSPICSRGNFNAGAQVRLVGYGSNTHTNTGVGTKRQVTVSVIGSNNVLFQDGNSNMQTCHGDSGGPAFQGANVVGVPRSVQIARRPRCASAAASTAGSTPTRRSSKRTRTSDREPSAASTAPSIASSAVYGDSPSTGTA